MKLIKFEMMCCMDWIEMKMTWIVWAWNGWKHGLMEQNDLYGNELYGHPMNQMNLIEWKSNEPSVWPNDLTTWMGKKVTG